MKPYGASDPVNIICLCFIGRPMLSNLSVYFYKAESTPDSSFFGRQTIVYECAQSIRLNEMSTGAQFPIFSFLESCLFKKVNFSRYKDIYIRF